jgi:hypothetical protein
VLTRTIKVSCSAQFLQTVQPRQKLLINVPGFPPSLRYGGQAHICSQSSYCTEIVFRLRPGLYRDAVPVQFSKSVTGDDNSSRYKVCTAIPPAPEKTYAMTAKTALPTHCVRRDKLYPSRHRDSHSAKVPGSVPGWLRRVTLLVPHSGNLPILPGHYV